MSPKHSLTKGISAWNPCRLRQEQNSPCAKFDWNSVNIEHAFDIASVREFCRGNHVQTSRFFQAAWTVVLATYIDCEEVCSSYLPLNDETTPFPVLYRCKVDGSKTFMQILQTFEELKLETSQTSKTDLHLSKETTDPFTLFDTCLSTGTCVDNESLATEITSGNVCLPSFC